MRELVSIIVPIFNVESYLNKCLESLINQTYESIEIILVNDGSTDNSSKICDEYSQKDNRIKVIHKKNEGVSIARNVGINASTGKYLFFIDSDDWIDLDVIEKSINNISDYSIVKVSHNLIVNNIKKKEISNQGEYSTIDFIKKIILGDVGGHSWGYLIDRKLLSNIRFDEKTSCMEDTLFIINCLMNTSKVKCINDIFYYHIINENGITCSKDKVLKNICNYMYSLDKIEEILIKNKFNTDYRKSILKKRIYLLEAEIAKIENKDELKTVINDITIIELLKEAWKQNINMNFCYKIFTLSMVNKKYSVLLLYFKLRRILKKIKNRR